MSRMIAVLNLLTSSLVLLYWICNSVLMFLIAPLPVCFQSCLLYLSHWQPHPSCCSGNLWVVTDLLHTASQQISALLSKCVQNAVLPTTCTDGILDQTAAFSCLVYSPLNWAFCLCPWQKGSCSNRSVYVAPGGWAPHYVQGECLITAVFLGVPQDLALTVSPASSSFCPFCHGHAGLFVVP